MSNYIESYSLAPIERYPHTPDVDEIMNELQKNRGDFPKISKAIAAMIVAINHSKSEQQQEYMRCKELEARLQSAGRLISRANVLIEG